MPIDTKTPGSDGWWLQRLYGQLRVQEKQCEAYHARYRGEAPLPLRTDNEQQVVQLFEKLSRRNFERLIVNAILMRLGVVGIRTAVDDDEGGDADGFRKWKKLRGKLWTADALLSMLSMGLGYVIVGRDPDDGELIVTAEDPRQVTAIADPANPYKVRAALKLFHDDVEDFDVAYLYLPGRVRVATYPRKARPGGAGVKFNPRAWDWHDDEYDGDQLISRGLSGIVNELAVQNADGTIGGLLPVVELATADRKAQFDPFIDHIDGIRKQILDRMTIATVQAFKQRAFKGLPKEDEDGNEIDYEGMFEAAPGAVWDLPESVEIWESGQADFSGIEAGIRNDIKDLYATAGTPGYLASPDAANASAEAASLQREMNVFNVHSIQDRAEPGLERVGELIFRYLGDEDRANLERIEIIWAQAELTSMSERANAIAQTKGVIPVRTQLTDIWGFTPAQADRAMTDLQDDQVLAAQFAAAQAAAQASAQATGRGSASSG